MNEPKKPTETRAHLDLWGLYIGLLVVLLFLADFGISMITSGGIEKSITFGIGRQIADLIRTIGGMTP